MTVGYLPFSLSLFLSLPPSLLSLSLCPTHTDGGQKSSYFASPSVTGQRCSSKPWRTELSTGREQSGGSTENGQETTSQCRCVCVCVCVCVCIHVCILRCTATSANVTATTLTNVSLRKPPTILKVELVCMHRARVQLQVYTCVHCLPMMS